jgi:hypothetical protein
MSKRYISELTKFAKEGWDVVRKSHSLLEVTFMATTGIL